MADDINDIAPGMIVTRGPVAPIEAAGYHDKSGGSASDRATGGGYV